MAAITSGRPVRGYSKDFKQPVGKEISCEWVQCILQSAIAADPADRSRLIIERGVGSGADAARLHFGGNAVSGTKRFHRKRNVIAPPPVERPSPVSPEQPPTTSNRG